MITHFLASRGIVFRSADGFIAIHPAVYPVAFDRCKKIALPLPLILGEKL